LTFHELNAIVAEAGRRWVEAISAPGVEDQLSGVEVRITDLDGRYLGLTSGSTIWIDENAGGYGWFVDPTPADDVEFLVVFGEDELRALPGTAASERADLLTVVMHEMGHVLALTHQDHGLMEETLELGVRHPSGCGCPACAAIVAVAEAGLPMLVTTATPETSAIAPAATIDFRELDEPHVGNPLWLVQVLGRAQEHSDAPAYLWNANHISSTASPIPDHPPCGDATADGGHALLLGGEGDDLVIGDLGRPLLIGGI
jgi:hypothetical protein